MGRILALDVGEKRIGVAVSDALNITAQGIGTIKRKNQKDTLDRLKGMIEEYDVSKVVVGLPFNMNGTKGRSAELVEEFASLLAKDLAVDVKMVDERLTTSQSEGVLLEADLSRKKRKSYIDKIAAQLILETYLDSKILSSKL